MGVWKWCVNKEELIRDCIAKPFLYLEPPPAGVLLITSDPSSHQGPTPRLSWCLSAAIYGDCQLTLVTAT